MSEETIVYGKKNPYLAKITERYQLSKPGSLKDTQHMVIGISGSGMTYETGDTLGVYPTNDRKAVEDLISALGFTGEEEVQLPRIEHKLSLRNAFLHHLALAQPTKKILTFLSERVKNSIEKERLAQLIDTENQEELAGYLITREYIDISEEFSSAEFSPQEYVDQFRKLQPRLYSIASSPVLYPNEVHLTVAVVRYKTNQRDRIGVATTYLAERVDIEVKEVPVFIAKSKLSLPEDPQADIIMVGPGTGIAPFRAFLQERDARKSKGRSWLFFGEQRRQYDFLYQEELKSYEKSGTLTHLSLAFSRDQDYKIYVQDRMRENAKELWEWIDSGAYLYLCGDAKNMARDVEAVLLEIFMQEGKRSENGAKEYLKILKKAKRYQKDVY